MRQPMIWGEPELTYVRKFFDGVDSAVTDEMQAGQSLLEENLTFVLARLLDGDSTFQRMLNYPLEKLNSDLQVCGSGSQMDVRFETHEHKKHFESAVSHADLGIVLRREPSVLGPGITKAVLVQSKKLFPVKDSYRLTSAYDSFDGSQFSGLKQIASKHGWESVCYFLYNPKLTAFAEDDAKILRALESQMASGYPWPFRGHPFWHPEMEMFFFKYLRHNPHLGLASGVQSHSPEEMLKERNLVVGQKPGLRVMGVFCVGHLVESNKTIKRKFRLDECYRYALSTNWWGNSGAVPFLPLSAFMVDLLLGCSHGSTNDEVIQIAEGRTAGPQAGPSEDFPGVAVRHTMRITVKSTLPGQDISFHG